MRYLTFASGPVAGTIAEPARGLVPYTLHPPTYDPIPPRKVEPSPTLA